MTGFCHAVFRKNFEIVELLLQDPRIDVNTTDNNGELTPFHWACENGYLRNIQAFIKHAKTRHIEVNARDENGQTPFMFACSNGYDMAVYLMLENIETLGIDVNAQDNRGRTALIWATIRNAPRCVDLLLNNYEKLNIDPNHVDENGMSALMYACKDKEVYALNCFLRMAKFLKLDFGLKDHKFNRTAYIWACIHAKKMDAFHDEFEFFAKYYKEMKIDLKHRDYKGRTGADYVEFAQQSGKYYGRTKRAKAMDAMGMKVSAYWHGEFEDPFEVGSDD